MENFLEDLLLIFAIIYTLMYGLKIWDENK
jgi:hypothetical protein